ncbi:hypothetical protein ACFL2R_01845 [Patescibacteria group bacterium]
MGSKMIFFLFSLAIVILFFTLDIHIEPGHWVSNGNSNFYERVHEPDPLIFPKEAKKDEIPGRYKKYQPEFKIDTITGDPAFDPAKKRWDHSMPDEEIKETKQPLFWEVRAWGNFPYKNGGSVLNGSKCNINLYRGHFKVINPKTEHNIRSRGKIKILRTIYDNDKVDYRKNECPKEIAFSLLPQEQKEWKNLGVNLH